MNVIKYPAATHICTLTSAMTTVFLVYKIWIEKLTHSFNGAEDVFKPAFFNDDHYKSFTGPS